MSNTPAGDVVLVDYFEVYGPLRFRGRGGGPPKRRTLLINAQKYRLPLIRLGWTTLIDPAQADARLRQFAKNQS